MSIRTSQALLAALAVVAAPAFAQDSTPATPATEADSAAEQTTETAPAATPSEAAPATTAPAAEAPAADAPATGTTDAPAAGTADAPAAAAPAAASGEPQPGSYYVKTTHQDWTLRCIKTDQANDPCELYQLMKDGSGNSVAEITMIPLRNGQVAAGATLVAPLETDLIEGLGFAIDSAKPRAYPFGFCAPVGCVSRMGFSEAELASLKKGGKGTVTLLPFGGDPKNPVTLNLSLSGFTAAFDELSAYAEKIAAEAPAPAQEPAPTQEPEPAPAAN
jgi:invasion protein IalB